MASIFDGEGVHVTQVFSIERHLLSSGGFAVIHKGVFMSVDFKEVRDSYALASFFEGLMGAKGKPVAGSIRYSVCPSCGPSSDASVKCSVRNERWHCFACMKKGDVVDAAAAFFGVPAADAAQQLVGQGEQFMAKRNELPLMPKVVRDQESINQVISMLLGAQKLPDLACMDYLCSRGISKEIVEDAVLRKMIVTLPGDPNAALRYLFDCVGRDLLLKSGIWKEGSKAPAVCYRPLAFVNSDERGIEFRLIGESAVAIAKSIRYGEPGPWVWKGNDHAMIVEGAIDLLSAVQMGTKRTVIGLPGAKNWNAEDKWLNALMGRHILVALDNDEAGQAGTKDLEEILKGRAIVRRYQHLAGCKDLNDQLKLEGRIN